MKQRIQHEERERLRRRFQKQGRTISHFERVGAMQILALLEKGELRYSVIQHVLQINSNTLSARLRELADQGLVVRRVRSHIPPHVTYELTPRGYDMQKVLSGLTSPEQAAVAQLENEMTGVG